MLDEKSGQKSNILIKVGGLLGTVAVATTALATIVTDGSRILEKLPFAKTPGTNEQKPPELSSGTASDSLVTTPSRRDSSSFENKPLMIMEARSGKCIDVAGAPGQRNGDRLQLWDCELSERNIENDSRTDQKWIITSDGYIRNELSGKCIDVVGAPGVHNGAGLALWNCELSGRNIEDNASTDQRWTITSNGHIVNKLSNRCIDVGNPPSEDNGVGLVLRDCELSTAFVLEGS